MVKGRLPRESNPLPGDKSGFVASHDTSGNEDYKRTSPLNPLPVKSIGDSNVKDAEVKAELELIKQSIADNKATNDLILARLDNPINTKVTGSNVEEGLFVNQGDYVEYETFEGIEVAHGTTRRIALTFSGNVEAFAVTCNFNNGLFDASNRAEVKYGWYLADYISRYSVNREIDTVNPYGFTTDRLDIINNKIEIQIKNNHVDKDMTNAIIKVVLFGYGNKEVTR